MFSPDLRRLHRPWVQRMGTTPREEVRHGDRLPIPAPASPTSVAGCRRRLGPRSTAGSLRRRWTRRRRRRKGHRQRHEHLLADDARPGRRHRLVLGAREPRSLRRHSRSELRRQRRKSRQQLDSRAVHTDECRWRSALAGPVERRRPHHRLLLGPDPAVVSRPFSLSAVKGEIQVLTDRRSLPVEIGRKPHVRVDTVLRSSDAPALLR